MDATQASPALVPIVQILGGLLLLFFGRKLFWVFVGVVGFLAGLQFGTEIMQGQPEWILLLVALVVGLVAALLAVVLQRVAVAVAGGLAGGVFAMQLATSLGAGESPYPLIAFVVGAIIAAILVSIVFDWALIILSSLLGAAAIAQGLPLEGTLESLVMLAIAVVGVVVQSAWFLRSPRVVSDERVH